MLQAYRDTRSWSHSRRVHMCAETREDWMKINFQYLAATECKCTILGLEGAFWMIYEELMRNAC